MELHLQEEQEVPFSSSTMTADVVLSPGRGKSSNELLAEAVAALMIVGKRRHGPGTLDLHLALKVRTTALSAAFFFVTFRSICKCFCPSI